MYKKSYNHQLEVIETVGDLKYFQTPYRTFHVHSLIKILNSKHDQIPTCPGSNYS